MLVPIFSLSQVSEAIIFEATSLPIVVEIVFMEKVEFELGLL